EHAAENNHPSDYYKHRFAGPGLRGRIAGPRWMGLVKKRFRMAGWRPSRQQIRGDIPDSAQAQLPWCRPNPFAERLQGLLRNLDPAGNPAGFQPAREVHRMTPDVVDEALAADQAVDDRSAVDADPQLDGLRPGAAGHFVV